MPLHVARLRDSDLAAEAHPEACWYAVMLWSASWHQLPAASLPDNETVLARLCGLGRDLKTFRRHRDDAMRGFVKCTDGRFYHPVVAEQAIAAWERKRQQAWRTECARIKKANQRNGTDLPTPTFEEFVAGTTAASPADVPEDTANCPPGQSLQERGRGTGIEERAIPDGMGAAAPPVEESVSDDLDELRALPIAKGCWRLAIRVLTERGRKTDAQARSIVGKLKGGGLSDDDLWEIAEQAWANGTLDPVPYLTKAAEQVVERRAGRSGIDAPSERQQRAWMEDWRTRGLPGWRIHERGPPPGQPGCRVAPEIVSEFAAPGAASERASA